MIAFYEAHRDEVDAHVTACQQEIDRQRADAPAGPGLAELRRRKQALAEERRR